MTAEIEMLEGEGVFDKVKNGFKLQRMLIENTEE
jgi:hypothetical protein